VIQQSLSPRLGSTENLPHNLSISDGNHRDIRPKSANCGN
jgi:hypothetical protein